MATLAADRKSSLRRELEGVVGPGGVLSEPDELLVYESDGLTLFRALADFVVFPTSAEQVSAVVRLAGPRGTAVRGPRRRHRALRRVSARRGRHRPVADADEPRARGGLRQPDRGRRARAGQPPPVVGGRPPGLLLRARPLESAGLHHRGQHRQQLRRPAHAEVRRDGRITCWASRSSCPTARSCGWAAARARRSATTWPACSSAPKAPSGSPPRSSCGSSASRRPSRPCSRCSTRSIRPPRRCRRSSRAAWCRRPWR